MFNLKCAFTHRRKSLFLSCGRTLLLATSKKRIFGALGAPEQRIFRLVHYYCYNRHWIPWCQHRCHACVCSSQLNLASDSSKLEIDIVSWPTKIQSHQQFSRRWNIWKRWAVLGWFESDKDLNIRYENKFVQFPRELCAHPTTMTQIPALLDLSHFHLLKSHSSTRSSSP